MEHIAEIVENPKKLRKAKKADALAQVNTAEIQAHESEAREALAFVSSYEIRSQENMDDCGDLLKEIVERKRTLEESLKSITGPMNEALKNVRNVYKPALQYCEKGEAVLKGVIKRFLDRQDAERDAALKLVADSGGRADPATLVIAHGHSSVELTESANARYVYVFRIDNPDLVPDKFKVTIINEKAIQEEANLTKGLAQIPGVTITRENKIINARRAA